jgi:hypothetical protein
VLHRGQHLRAWPDTELLAEPALIAAEGQAGHEEDHSTLRDDLEDVEVAPALGIDERLMARAIELDTHGVWAKLADDALDVSHAALRHVGRSHEIDVAPLVAEPEVIVGPERRKRELARPS